MSPRSCTFGGGVGARAALPVAEIPGVVGDGTPVRGGGGRGEGDGEWSFPLCWGVDKIRNRWSLRHCDNMGSDPIIGRIICDVKRHAPRARLAERVMHYLSIILPPVTEIPPISSNT